MKNPLRKIPKGSSIKYVRKTFRKNNISNPLIRIHTSKLAVVREKFVFFQDQVKEINELPLLLSLCIKRFDFP